MNININNNNNNNNNSVSHFQFSTDMMLIVENQNLQDRGGI
jgi:hypothetical protein